MKFGPFVFDASNGTLTRNGESIALSHRALALLGVLLNRRGEVVDKETLLDAAWPGQAVEESNLTVQIAALRRALGTTADGQDWVATVPRVGYRFLAASAASRTESEKPTIAVLPFDNVSNDPEQEFFAQGLAEDLITDLSRVSGLMVIARNSSFAMKERRSDIRGVAADLSVRFVIDGSVRRSANRVRINVQLIEAADQSQLWAERFDGDLADVFALQDQVVSRIVGALQRVLSIGAAPAQRRVVDLEAYDCFLRGRSLVLTSLEGFHQGHPLLLRATEIDPNFAEGFAWLAMSYVHAWLNWGQPREENRKKSIAVASRAVALDSDNADAQTFLGYARAIGGELDAGLAGLNRALEIDPSHADALMLKAEILVDLGRPDEGVASAEAGFKLNPFAPAWYLWALGFAQYAAGRYEETVATLERKITRHTVSDRLLAASYAQLGRLNDARRMGAEFLAIAPYFTITDWSDAHPFSRMADRQRFIDGLRMAGLPD